MSSLGPAVAKGRRAIRIFAIAVMVAAILSAIVAERTLASVSDGLHVADTATVAAAAAVGPAGQLADDLSSLADSLAQGTKAAARLADTASTSTGQVAIAAQDNLATTLDGLAKTANRLATATERIERLIPGDAKPSAADELRDVADGLEPTADQLRDIGTQLDTASSDLADIADQLETSAKDVAAIGADIDEAKATIDTLPGLVAEVQTSVDRTQDRLATDLWLIRLLIVALTFAVLSAAYTADRALVALGALPLADPAPEDPPADPSAHV